MRCIAGFGIDCRTVMTYIACICIAHGMQNTAGAEPELVFYSSFAKEESAVHRAGGQVTYGSSGMYLDVDTRVDVVAGTLRRVSNGSIELDVIIPRVSRALVPNKFRADECQCSFTIITGRLALALTDTWIELRLLEPSLKKTQTVFGRSAITLNPDEKHQMLVLSFLDNIAVVSLNKHDVLTETAQGHDLNHVALVTYHHPLTVAGLSVFSTMPQPITIDSQKRYVEITADWTPSSFNSSSGLKNHHFIVWEKGRAAQAALLRGHVPDSVLHDALITIGARPGNTLSIESWEQRGNRVSTEPDKRAEGDSIAISIRFGGQTFYPGNLLADQSSRAFDFRFTGNRTFIPHWKSGCIACLQSCPGGKTGNRSYTMRDLEKKIPRFDKKSGLPFHEGDAVVVRFSRAQINK